MITNHEAELATIRAAVAALRTADPVCSQHVERARFALWQALDRDDPPAVQRWAEACRAALLAARVGGAQGTLREVLDLAIVSVERIEEGET